MAKIIHWYEHRAHKKYKNREFFQANVQCSFWENNGKCEKKKNRNVKLVKTEARRIYLVSEPNNYTTKSFSEKILAIEIKKHKYPRINQPI